MRFGTATLVFLLCVCASASAEDSLEYKVKAGFLLNFTKFAEWPAEALGDKDAPIIIGVLGDNPFGPLLEKTVQNREVEGHKVSVRKYKQAKDAREAHVLFIGLKGDQLAGALKALEGSPTLTVGESDGFIDAGGMVRFIIRDEKVGFEINPATAKKAGLKIGAQLLRLAKVVGAKGE